MKAARSVGRHGQRDATLILLASRHGLRVSELVALKWGQVDLKQGHLAVVRAKNGTDSTHPLRGPEIRALRRLKREYGPSPYVFVTDRKGPLTASTVRKLVARAGEGAGISFSVHPHMLRHYVEFRTMPSEAGAIVNQPENSDVGDGPPGPLLGIVCS